jgi:hypothetical protein
MNRIIQLAAVLGAAFCVATVIASVAIVSYVGVKWHIDREKLAKIVAVAQGVPLAAKPENAIPTQEEVHAEQISYDQILEARAVKVRNLELREQALKNSLDQVRVEQNKLADEQTVFGKIRQGFTEQVAAIRKHDTEAGFEAVVGDLSILKPKQAKEFILLMLKKDEDKQVVSLLLPMNASRRAKIFSEFKTPEELEKADALLRLIRQGEPTADIAEGTQQQLSRANPAEPQETRQ